MVNPKPELADALTYGIGFRSLGQSLSNGYSFPKPEYRVGRMSATVWSLDLPYSPQTYTPIIRV